ncbi:MAG: hypothetical protein ACQETL_06265 [Bacteroidota bacterium]
MNYQIRRMKKLNPIFLLLLIILSCEPEPEDSSTEYTLINSTPCPVEVTGYLNGEVLDTYLIDENADFYKSFNSFVQSGAIYPPPFEPHADSCLVVYCGTDSVTHLRSYDDLYFSSPIKNLFHEDDYEIETDGERVSYVFEFTQEDYERAMEINRRSN